MPDNNIVLTADQFQQLLGSIQAAQPGPPAQLPVNPPPQVGNFSKCSSRFSGEKNESIDAFIDAITVYKNCVNISDNNALLGLPMLLDGPAATYWQGVKASVGTWNEAVDALRHSYGNNKPAFKIFRELFATEQRDREPTEIFVNNARALLAKLPQGPVLDEQHKLDMIYGLLHKRIRKLLPRDEVQTFDQLITKARSIEDNFLETAEGESNNIKHMVSRLRCDYCRNYGHDKRNCRKLANKKPNTEIKRETELKPEFSSIKFESKPKEMARELICYGCKSPGHIRSNCPQRKSTETGGIAQGINQIELMMAHIDSNECYSLVKISVCEMEGLVYIDTGAKRSVAGRKLLDHLLGCNIPSVPITLDVTLADGIKKSREALRFDVVAKIEERSIPISFIGFPDFQNNKTLLGIDFAQTAGIVLDMSHNRWYFSDNPDSQYFFYDPPKYIKGAMLNSIQVQLRDEEGQTLDEVDRQNVNCMLQEYSDVFERNKDPTPYAEHSIKLTHDDPISVPPYRMSPLRSQVLRQELRKMLELGIIEECESAYAAPVVLVPKPNDTFRVCIDYRKLNEVTIPDRYPLPRLDDLLHAATPTLYMSTIDLQSGYWQVAVKLEDRDKTAFITPFGLFRFNRMPFGLRNAPATFQRMMDHFRAGLSDILILIYLDDIIILSSSLEKHKKDLEAVFTRLQHYKLTANRDKCVFFCPQVKYLGHIITPDGLKPDPGKIQALVERTAPTNVKELLSFLQTCNWFRRFVPEFAKISKPLSQLTRKNVVWCWGSEQQESFNKLKQLLTSPPILRPPDPNLPYVIKTDASSYAIGACLLQGTGTDERPVEYASRLLNSAERNYNTTEREALAVVFAIEKFRGYIEGIPFSLATDHRPLKWLMRLKSPSGRLARWALVLQSYDITIDYVPGKANAIADTLSRPVHPENDSCNLNLVTCTFPTLSIRDVREDQLNDPELKKIITCFEDPSDDCSVKKWVDRGYYMFNGVLYRFTPNQEQEEPQLVIPVTKVSEILKECHEHSLAGHYGIDKTCKRVSKNYFWPTIHRDVTNYVRKCGECQRYKPDNLKPCGLMQTPVMCQRFEVIAIDLVGPLPEADTGEQWIFTIEDTATRWIELFPLVSATAIACAKCLVDEFILRYGCPRKVISDNGVQFVGEVMQYVTFCLGIKQILTPVYHPEANPIERRHRDLKTQLAIFVGNDQRKWKEALPSIRFAMNSAIHSAIGFSPAYLCFGRELKSPGVVHRDLRVVVENENFIPEITPKLTLIAEVMDRARENSEKRQDANQSYVNSKRRSASFQPGDKILIDSHVLSNSRRGFSAKLAPRRDGPYIILSQASPTTYHVASLKEPEVSLGKYHVSALQPFASSNGNECPVMPLRKRGRPKRTGEPEGVPEPPPSEVEAQENNDELSDDCGHDSVIDDGSPVPLRRSSRRITRSSPKCTAPCCSD